ncbi:endopolygalacturonase PGb, partial [Dissophora ornata]
GTITFAKGNLDQDNFLVTIGGTNINIDATKGIFNGNGPLYWDGKGANSGVNKPKFVRLTKMSGSITGLTILGSPIHTFSINGCKGLTLSGVTIDNRGTNYALGHNTDGFDISSSSGVTVTGAHVYNNDDCLAINSGTNIAFTNNYCSGGHGISIGSIKAGAIVDGVTVSGCTVVDSDNAVRIKAYPNATGGKVNNVTYSDITMSGIQDYGIVIEQDYTNDGPTGTPGGAAPITNVNLNNVHGTVASKGQSVYILCANCSEFNFQKIAITGGLAANCTGISPKPLGC